MSNIQRLWLSERVPAVNGIYFPDDSVCLVNFSRLERLGTFSISSLERLQELPDVESTSDLTETCSANLNGLRAVGGEGSSGGDGFVALLDGEQLRWIAFFDCSNPFDSVCLERERVVAKSSHGVCWIFPLDNPEAFAIE